jgi:hypothetical protein
MTCDARGLIERRNADQPVNASLGREQPVRVVTGHDHRHALDSSLVAGLEIDDVAPKSATLGPAQIHAHEHLGPVLRLGAARTGMNRDNRVLLVELAGQHRPNLGRLHVARVAFQRGPEIGRHVFAVLGPIEQHGQVIGLLF